MRELCHKVRFSFRTIIASTLAGALLACGGGGGGDGGNGTVAPPSTPVAINATNAPAVAGESVDALMQSANSTALVFGVAVTSDPPPPMPFTRLLAATAKRVSAGFDRPASGAQVTAVMTTQPCAVSGSLTVDQPDNMSETFTFDACSDVAGETVNGRVSISAISGTATNFSANVSADVSVSFSGPFAGQPSVHVVGSLSFVFSEIGPTEVLVISGSNLSVTIGSHAIVVSNFTITTTIDLSIDAFDVTSSFTIASARLNGTVNIVADGALHLVSGRRHPSQGSLVVTGANGSHLRVTILGDETAPPTSQVQLEIDADGNGVYEQTVNKTWSEIDGA